MSKNKKTGQWGEKIAADYLISMGYEILDYNYRFSRSEIDLIAKEDETLVFVEVKTRTNLDFGFPEEFANGDQEMRILEASEHYIYETAWTKAIRYDIIAITKNEKTDIKHFKDVFH